MRFLYYLKVFIVGYEVLSIFLCLAVFLLFGDFLDTQFRKASLNEDALKWAMLFPVSISGWTFKEGVAVIFPDDKTSKILHEWPEYWRLKAHFDIGILNSIIFLLPCMAVWFFGKLVEFYGVWVFFTFAVALSLNAFSFYSAKIHIRSELMRVDGS